MDLLPDDIHYEIIDHLSLIDILEYQQVCTTMWDIIANSIVILSLDKLFKIKKPRCTSVEFLKLIGRRFPNLVEINFNDEQRLRFPCVLEALKNCRNLELISGSEHSPFVHTGWSLSVPLWKNQMEMFPNYAAISAPYAYKKHPEEHLDRIQEIVQPLRITHLSMPKYPHLPSLRIMLGSISDTLTHLYIGECKNSLPNLINLLPKVTQLRSVYIADHDGPFEKLFKKTPHLEKFVAQAFYYQRDVEALAIHCPNIRYLHMQLWCGTRSLPNLPNLRSLTACRLGWSLDHPIYITHLTFITCQSLKMFQKVPKIRSLTLAKERSKWWPQECYSEILHTAAKHCKELEEITVPVVSKPVLEMLKKECPRLLYVFLGKSKVIDVRNEIM